MRYKNKKFKEYYLNQIDNLARHINLKSVESSINVSYTSHSNPSSIISLLRKYSNTVTNKDDDDSNKSIEGLNLEHKSTLKTQRLNGFVQSMKEYLLNIQSMRTSLKNNKSSFDHLPINVSVRVEDFHQLNQFNQLFPVKLADLINNSNFPNLLNPIKRPNPAIVSENNSSIDKVTEISKMIDAEEFFNIREIESNLLIIHRIKFHI